jgi:VanZ family protein
MTQTLSKGSGISPLFFRAALALALTSILYLSTTALATPLPKVENADKLQHLLAFFVLAWLLNRSFPDISWGWNQILLLFAYGFLIEIIQYFIPYRFFSIWDLVANSVGLILYTLAIHWGGKPVNER